MTASLPATTPRGGALVTGAGRRLGREIALGLAADGWDVAVHYRRSAQDARETVRRIEALGRRACAVGAELGEEAQVDAMFDAAQRALPLRLVVNSASMFEYDTPAQFRATTLDAHMGPNLAAPLRLARRLYEALGEEGRGAVINLLDQKLENLNPDFFSYTLSKYALLGATRMMAMAFAPRLRVVGISPGITLISGDQTPEGFARAHRRTPLGRSSTPQDIVRAAVFLADAPAITGVNLLVDGGQHLTPLARDVMYLND